jgi:hypothetical protein
MSFSCSLAPLLCAGLLTAGLLASCKKNDPINQAAAADKAAGIAAPGLDEVKAIAEEGFVYGLPLVMNYAVMHDFFIDASSPEFKVPFNTIKSEARVFTWQDTTVITPNSDTPYSTIGFDLRAEPIVISVPAVEAPRYYSVQLCDSNTFIFGYIGSRSTGTAAGDYLIAGPDWQGEAPAGIKKVFRSSSRFGMAIFRTQLFQPDDLPNVVAIQKAYQARPLSAFTGQPAPAAPPAIDFPKVDKELVKTNFFEYLNLALGFAPPGPEEVEIRAKLARIGIGAGKSFDFKELSPKHKAAVVLGLKAGEKKVAEKVASIGKEINGWRVGASFGDRDFYKGDWLLRAAAAKAGIYGNAAEEAMYPMTKTTADGTPIDTSKHNYTLTFPAGQLPPVNAFWSVTMYDGKTQLLIKNPLDRYLINTPMLPGMKKNADGSLTIHIRKDSPGPELESNWLPAPNGPVFLTMRLYWPKTREPSILPPGEGTWKPPGIQKSD